jgi:trk system potassium uptake protein TrkA
MNIIIVGFGRVGVELALSLCKENLVTVIDNRSQSFDRLGSDFRGRTVQGEGLDNAVLERARIETANALAAVTTSDNVNVIVGRVARDVYHIPHVVARVYNPRRIPIYEKFGLQTVASSTWGAQRIEQLILHPGVQSVFSAGNGEIQLYEINIPNEWAGRSLCDLIPVKDTLVVSLVRAGRATLPEQTTVLQTHDILHISAASEAVAILRQRLHTNGKE